MLWSSTEAWAAAHCCHLLDAWRSARCGWSNVPPHCNRFQVVLDMMETLSTSGKRSALVRGRLRCTFPSWHQRPSDGPQGCDNQQTHWLSAIKVSGWVAHTHTHLGEFPEMRPFLLKRVPIQGHRFQMVLDLDFTL